MGVKIKDLPLVENPTTSCKMPVSDGVNNVAQAVSISQIIALVGGSENFDMITEDAYEALKDAGTLKNTLYFIKDSDGELQYIYYKETLIAKKASGGEAVSAGFPMIFPIVFS